MTEKHRQRETERQDEAGEESQLGDGQRFCVQRTAGASKDEEGSTPDAVADTGSRLAGSGVAGRLGSSGRHAGTSDSRPQETRRLAGLPERHFRKQFRLQERGRLDIRRQLVPREWILGRQDYSTWYIFCVGIPIALACFLPLPMSFAVF